MPASIHAMLDAGFLAHVGFNVDGQPFVIPTLYGREDDKLYLHGSAASRMLREVETGIPASVTLVDGFVLARAAFHHSMTIGRWWRLARLAKSRTPSGKRTPCASSRNT